MGEKVYEVTIGTLVYGGDGMGRLDDGRAIFTPFCLPGERVRVRIVEEKRGFARGELLEVIEASSMRVPPRCKHFGICGECHYQHIPYDDQVMIKKNILIEQLQRLGGVESPPVDPVEPSPLAWNYRNSVQFHLTREGRLGFQKSGGQEVIGVEECSLPDGMLNEIWPQIQTDPQAGVKSIHLRKGSEDDVLLVLESNNPLPEEFEVDIPISAVHLGPEGPVLLAGDDHIIVEVAGRPFKVSAGSFFQENTLLAEVMADYVRTCLPLSQDKTALDLYCGVGLFSAMIAPHVGQLTGIEISLPACDDFATNLDEFDHVELYNGDVEVILPNLDRRYSFIIADPPRNGLTPAVIDAICRQKPEALVYVSCDPATLARDVRKLIAGGFALQAVKPFDLFPQTHLIGSVNLLTRR